VLKFPYFNGHDLYVNEVVGKIVINVLEYVQFSEIVTAQYAGAA